MKNFPKTFSLKNNIRISTTKFLPIIYIFVSIILVAILGLSLISIFNLPVNIKVYTVSTGSMSPAIFKGSTIIIHKNSSYRVGDIITFFPREAPPELKNRVPTTHRIINVINAEGKVSYQTKGDTNEGKDLEFVEKDAVLGKVIVSIPLIGYPIQFVKTLPGFLLLVIVPCVYVIVTEIMTIKNELQNKRKSNK